MANRALIVFLKHPKAGTVKTRLIPVLGEGDAAELYRALAEAVVGSTVPQRGEYERLLFFTPPQAADSMRAWLPGLRLLPQSGADLGARMASAFDRAFQRGAERAAIIGTDAPGVTGDVVAGALEELGSADVVVGPAEDGGYYLLALREPHPELFEGVDWSTPRVLEQTRTRASGAGLSVRQLQWRRDVDTLEDLRAEWPLVRDLLQGRPELRDRIEAVLAKDAGARNRAGEAPGREHCRTRRRTGWPR